MTVRDAIDEFEADTMPLRRLWLASDARANLSAMDRVIGGGSDLVGLLVDHAPVDEAVAAAAQDLFVDTVRFARLLLHQPQLPVAVTRRARAASMVFLGALAEYVEPKGLPGCGLPS